MEQKDRLAIGYALAAGTFLVAKDTLYPCQSPLLAEGDFLWYDTLTGKAGNPSEGVNPMIRLPLCIVSAPCKV